MRDRRVMLFAERVVTFRYAVAPGVHSRRLDDEVAVYLAEKFETHLLDDAGGQVLEAVLACESAGVPASLNRLFGYLSAGAQWTPGGTSGELADDASDDAATVLLPLLTALAQVGVLDARAC
jgi:hypothetical protein